MFQKSEVARVAKTLSKKTDICLKKARLPGLPGHCLLISNFICENQGCQGCQTGWVEKNGHMFRKSKVARVARILLTYF